MDTSIHSLPGLIYLPTHPFYLSRLPTYLPTYLPTLTYLLTYLRKNIRAQAFQKKAAGKKKGSVKMSMEEKDEDAALMKAATSNQR